jgi:nucleoside-diphosphate-sugar epimerase
LCAQQADVHLIVRDRISAREIFSDYEIDGQIFEIDLRDSEAVENVFEEIRPAITFNLAGYGIDPGERDETTANQINAQLVKTICGAMKKVRNEHWNGQDLIHVGSALEYGVVSGNLDEQTEAIPTTQYGITKLEGTRYLAHFSEAQGLKGLTARLFTVYGPGELAGRLLPSLLATAKSGASMQLTAGQQRRDFTYVEEVAEGLLRLGLTTSSPDKIINVATGKLQTVRSFVETAANVLQIPTNILNFGALPQRSEEMSHSDVTIERLRKLVGWVPDVSITEGILRTANFENSLNGDLLVHH